MIKRRGALWILYSHAGKVLGTHTTEEDAERQERAINISKARAAGHRIPRTRASTRTRRARRKRGG